MEKVRRVFAFDGASRAPEFSQRGFSLIPDGADPAFLAFARAQLEAHRWEGANISGRYDKRGMKAQYLFRFPEEDEATLLEGAVEALGALTGLPADRLVLSERHLKIYLPDADPAPIPHKDRRSSQISVGIPLTAPPESRVILYPDHERWENPFDSYDALMRSMRPEQRPEVALAGVEPVSVETRPGDVLVFFGATMYHERIKGAGTEILYLKWNALGLDPIGENPACLPLARRRDAVPVDAVPVG